MYVHGCTLVCYSNQIIIIIIIIIIQLAILRNDKQVIYGDRNWSNINLIEKLP
jgi:hypothetical protein